MFVDDLKTARKISLAILLITIQLVVIAAFGSRWTSGGTYAYFLLRYVPGMSPPYSVIIPYPSYAEWWFGLTAIIMYLVLVLCFSYIAWTIAQIAFPSRFEFDMKILVFIDVCFSSLLTIMLILAYSFFAGGFGGKGIVGMGLGYCFWLAVISSIASFSVVVISGLSWYRNN